MLRIAICDDQDESLRLIDRALDNYLADSQGSVADVSRYENPDAFLSDLHLSGGWDIVILDVCMPGMNGMDLAREIRSRHDRTEIIFISFSSDYAVEAFAFNAVHYVLKPFEYKDFKEAMDRAVGQILEKGSLPVMLQLENGIMQIVDADDILYIESVGYRRIVHTRSAVYEETKKSLSKMIAELEELTPGQFIQPYRGYIVNLDAIRTISSDKIIMQNGDFILIKRGDFRHLKDLFFKWSFRGRNLIV